MRKPYLLIVLLALCAVPARTQNAPVATSPAVLTVHAAVRVHGISVHLDGGETLRHHTLSLSVVGGVWNVKGEIQIVSTDYLVIPTGQYATFIGFLDGRWTFIAISLIGHQQRVDIWIGARVLAGDATGAITLHAEKNFVIPVQPPAINMPK